MTRLLAIFDRPFIVMSIGCLECYHSTLYRGSFRTVAQAKAAHPYALTYKEQSDKGWRGESVEVIFDTRRIQDWTSAE